MICALCLKQNRVENTVLRDGVENWRTISYNRCGGMGVRIAAKERVGKTVKSTSHEQGSSLGGSEWAIGREAFVGVQRQCPTIKCRDYGYL